MFYRGFSKFKLLAENLPYRQNIELLCEDLIDILNRSMFMVQGHFLLDVYFIWLNKSKDLF